MAQRRAHAGREARLKAPQARARPGVEGLIEVFAAQVVHVVAAIGAKTVQGKGVADARQGLGQDGAGGAHEFEHGLLLAVHLFVGRFRQVEQHQQSQVALVHLAPHHDARVGLLA